MSDHTAPELANRSLRRGLLLGLTSGLAAITCCVSPIVLVLLGVATAAEAVTLGDTLYYDYGWYFRAAGTRHSGVGGHPVSARPWGVQRARRLSVPTHADRAGGIRRGHLRQPLLVHQVPRYLVRLKVGAGAGAIISRKGRKTSGSPLSLFSPAEDCESLMADAFPCLVSIEAGPGRRSCQSIDPRAGIESAIEAKDAIDTGLSHYGHMQSVPGRRDRQPSRSALWQRGFRA